MTIVVSYSELDTFRQCPLKHHVLYRQRWTKPPKEGGALVKGTMWHLVMETHYRELVKFQKNITGKGPSSLDRCREAVAPLLSEPGSGAQTDTQKLIEWMYEGYIAQHGADLTWEIVAVEHHMQHSLGLNQAGEEIEIKAKLDLIIRDKSTRQLWVVDHKSGANLPDQMDLELDDQFGLYVWLMHQMGKPVVGAIHNAARTTRNKADEDDYTGKLKPQTLEQRHRRTLLSRSDAELKNIAHDAMAAATAAYPGDPRYEAHYSSPDPRSCGWKCDIKEAHLMMRQGRAPSEILPEYGFHIDRTRH